jgi:ABC-type nitrate/sulfonate/bicarbonate transport system substrate-binding protein
VKSQRNISGRTIIASADFVKNHRATLEKFMRVLDGCIDWAYSREDESSKMYGMLNKVDAPTATKALAFYKRSTLAFGTMAGWDEVVKQSLDAKFISAPPTPDQVKDLVDIVYTTGK